ncbi:MAG: YHS domain-containing protein [Chloroflexi bacterium]|nr:MAG: YHS domain-containing protein [Chloroflexota bacterium]
MWTAYQVSRSTPARSHGPRVTCSTLRTLRCDGPLENTVRGERFRLPRLGDSPGFGYFCSVPNEGKMLDPVCDMIVNIAEQREQGLTIERPEREYAFCGPGCLQTFAKDPKRYIPKVERWLATGESAPPRM